VCFETTVENNQQVRNLPGPTVGVEEHIQPSSAICEGREPLPPYDMPCVQGHPGERGERQVPLGSCRACKVPVEETHEPAVLPRGVVRRRIVVTDQLSRSPLTAFAPDALGWWDEIGDSLVIAAKPPGYLDQCRVFVNPTRPRLGRSYGLSRQITEHFTSGVVIPQRARSVLKAGVVQVLQQSMNPRGPWPRASSHRPVDKHGATRVAAWQHLLHSGIVTAPAYGAYMTEIPRDNVPAMVKVEIRRATQDDLAIVLRVLDDAAAWLSSRGIHQWPVAFEPHWISPDIEAGETWLALKDDSPVATLTLGWSDPLWPDDGRAGYVHRLARKRDTPGLGDALLDWVAEQVEIRGRDFIRLDCVATNQVLRAYYEDRAFKHRGDAAVGGVPGERAEAGPKTLVSLYERALLE